MKTLVSATDEFEKILGINNDPYPIIGFSECFPKDDYTYVENTIKDLCILGIKDLKIEISYSDFKDGGSKWYDWLVAKLSSELNLLISIPLYPKEILEAADSYTAFIDTILKSYDHIDIFEFRIRSTIPGQNQQAVDENYHQLLTEWIHKAHLNAKKIILGGIYPYDSGWLEKITNGNLLKSADIIGVSAFPEVFDLNWKGWNLEIDPIENLLKECNSNAEIWITETGYSTWRNDDQKQILRFIDVVKNNFNRIYWKSLYDLSSRSENRNESIQDQREYFYGIKKANGLPKLLYRMLSQHKPSELEQKSFLCQASNLRKNNLRKGILITGGAGFIGTNLANRLLNQGKRVIIYDNLSRPGVENNLNWLLSTYPDLEIVIADVADFHSLQKAVNEAEHIFHFAAQVAVTSSLQLPFHDFQVNAGGTINVLEAIRQSRHKPSLVFTSTNKVYGDLSNVELKSDKKRYFPVNKEYFRNGINEEYPLNFLSPYGNSKGCADQYVLDYSRSFDLRNVVFRMSCIYGPHQFGTEDQGWIAHFLNQSIHDHAITIYGDGKQVRDVLYVEDLVDAFLLAMKYINDIPGQVFNIGGGPSNAISLIDLIAYMHKLDHLKIHVIYDTWRTGDQKYYVSDTRKFRERTGWLPKVSYQEGIANIFSWLSAYEYSQNQKTMALK